MAERPLKPPLSPPALLFNCRLMVGKMELTELERSSHQWIEKALMELLECCLLLSCEAQDTGKGRLSTISFPSAKGPGAVGSV